MRRLIILGMGLIAAVSLSAEPVTDGKDGHPRLLVTGGEDFAAINSVVQGSEMLKTIETYIFKIADETLDKYPNVRKLNGHRLLNVSVDCFTRIFHSAYAYRASGEYKYARRAIDEMLAVARFKDWNPQHFLDVAEMMCAMAIGYDWLYHIMNDVEKEEVRNALIEKGLEPCLNLDYCGHWLNSVSNWNQVCNAGCTLAALALIAAWDGSITLVRLKKFNIINVFMRLPNPNSAAARFASKK